MRTDLYLSLLVSLLAITACGGENVAAGEEDVGSAEQAFGSSSCGTAAANYATTGFIDPAHVSPSSYNTCYRGYVVDIGNLSASYVGPGIGDGSDAQIRAWWGAAAPTTQSSCEAAWGSAIFYKKVGSTWVDQTGPIDRYGTWHPAGMFNAYCDPPNISSLYGGLTLAAGASYRVAATMRTAYGGATLRSISIENFKREIID